MGWVSEASGSLRQNGCVAKTSQGSSRAPGSTVRESQSQSQSQSQSLWAILKKATSKEDSCNL